jgi:hypothetical protein
MARGGHGLPKEPLGPTMPYPSTLTAVSVLARPLARPPARRPACGRLLPPLCTPLTLFLENTTPPELIGHEKTQEEAKSVEKSKLLDRADILENDITNE